MGKVLSLMNPFRNYNIEGRAHKVISQVKPVAAPKFKTDQLTYDRMMKEYPEAFQESLQKHSELDKHLKDVYVTSKKEVIPGSQPERPLPLDRSEVEDFDFGFKEPNKIPEGKTTLRKSLQFITKHQADPKVYNAKKIAEEHLLPEETVKNILKNFRVFEVYIPQERKPKAKFAGPSLPKVKVIKEIRKAIPPPGSQGDDKT